MDNLELELPVDRLTDDERLSKAVVARGVLSSPMMDLIRRQSRDGKLPLWRVLMNMNIVNAPMLKEIADKLGPPPTPPTPIEAPAPPPAAVPIDQASDAKRQGEAGRSTIREELAGVLQAGSPSELVDAVIDAAFDCRATDIHFDPQDEGELRVRFRIDAELHDIVLAPAALAAGVVSRIKLLANMNIIEKRDAQDGHIVQTLDDRVRNLRIATLPTHRGERLVARLLDESRVFMGLDRLGFSTHQAEIVERLLNKPYGMLIVTGPVGSGKTTTLYSCIQHINRATLNIMTIEDPVEYSLPGVNQSQVELKTEWTFPKALRALLRQDPDVIMVGEVRDDETAQIATRASLTGVLVLTSMHANDAASTVSALYNFGIPGYLLSTSLLGVVAQRLVRKINLEASEAFAPDERTRNLLRLEPGDRPDLMLKRGKGSSADFGTGYIGRTGVFEIMELNDALRDLVFRETPKDVIREVAIDMGMLPIADHAIQKVLDGVTTIEEAFRVALL